MLNSNKCVFPENDVCSTFLKVVKAHYLMTFFLHFSELCIFLDEDYRCSVYNSYMQGCNFPVICHVVPFWMYVDSNLFSSEFNLRMILMRIIQGNETHYSSLNLNTIFSQFHSLRSTPSRYENSLDHKCHLCHFRNFSIQ